MDKLTNWKRNIWIFKVDSFFNWFFIPIGIWVLFNTKFLSFTQIGIVSTVSLFWSMLLELPTGSLADLIGRKKTLLIGRFFYILSFIAYVLADNFWLILLAQILSQTDGAFNSGAQSALLYDSLKENGKEEEHYKKTEAGTFMYNTLGMALASAIGGLLFSYNFRLPYLVMIPISITGFIIACFYQEPYLDTKKFSLKEYVKQNYEGAKHIFSNQAIRAVSFFTIAVNFVAYTGLWYLYEPRLAAENFAPQALAFLVSGTYLIRAFGTRLIPLAEKKLKPHQIPIFLGLLQTFGSSLSFIGGKAGAISTVYTRKFSDGFRYPLLIYLQNKEISSKYRATALSAINLLGNFSISLVGIFIGMSIDKLGAANTLGLFTFFGLIFVIPLSFNLSRIILTQKTMEAL